MSTPKMPTLTLYRVNGSCSLIPHALLRELSIPFTAVRMCAGANGFGYQAADGSFSHAEYKAKINPSGLVPALAVDDDDASSSNTTVVTENPAILTYIASLAPERGMLGSTLLEKAKAVEWMVWLSGTLHSTGFGAMWRPVRFVEDAEEMYGVVEAKGLKNILRCYERIEERLEGKHAVGHRLTVVDFQLHTFWRWGHAAVDVDMVKQYPKYTALARDVERLPSVTAVMIEEEQPLNFESS